jgi:hypothetical protein
MDGRIKTNGWTGEKPELKVWKRRKKGKGKDEKPDPA